MILTQLLAGLTMIAAGLAFLLFVAGLVEGAVRRCDPLDAACHRLGMGFAVAAFALFLATLLVSQLPYAGQHGTF